MDVTPMIPRDRSVIDSYGPDRFRISGEIHRGSLLVFPDRVSSWSVTAIDDLKAEHLTEIASMAAGSLEILLLGCGPKMVLVPRSLRESALSQGVTVEVMDTGAACRTYNVLLAEERRVGAALIAL
jgi:uncharacterized protein